MTNQQLQFLMQQFSGGNRVASSDPSASNFDPFDIEPDVLASPTPRPYLPPHEAEINIPPSVFPQPPKASAFDVGGGPQPMGPQTPRNPTGPGTLNDQFPLPTNQLPTNEAMYPSDRGYFPSDFPPDFNSDVFPDTVYNPPTNEGMTFNNDQYRQPDFTNPPTNENMVASDQGGYFPADQPPDFSNIVPGQTAQNPSAADYFGQNRFDVPFGGNDTASVPSIYPEQGNYLPGEYEKFMEDTAATGTSAPAAQFDNTEPTNTFSDPVVAPYNQRPSGILGDPNPSGPPSAANIVTTGSGGMLDSHGEVIPGTAAQQTDEARKYNMQPFGDPRYSLSSALHPGQTFVHILSDGTRILVDAAGKAVGAGVQGAKDLWNNIMTDPTNTDPGYLASIGYHEMGDPGSGFMIPEGVSGPSVGGADVGTYGAIEGGSYFHGGASAGAQHGATSVAGATAGGTSGPFQLGDTTWGRTMASNYLRRMYKGLYTSPDEFGLMKQAMPSPFATQPLGSQMNPGWNWNTFHSGQTQLGDILRANPAYYQSLINTVPRGGGGGGITNPAARLSHGTPTPSPQ